MQKYNIMIIDDQYQERKTQYNDFFKEEYNEIDVAFELYAIEYGRDVAQEIQRYYKDIDAFFVDARLDNPEKGWGEEFDVTFNTVLSQIERAYGDITIPPIFMLSQHWQDDKGLLTRINIAFAVFHNPLHASRYYNQSELEQAIQDAKTKDSNGDYRIYSLRTERKYIETEILKNRSVKYNSKAPVDVVIQVAVPDEKRRAYQILDLAENNDKYLRAYGLSYQETDYKDQHIVIVSQVTMGMAEAARTTTSAILAFRPKAVVMIGICAGKRDKTNLGDLIVANNVFDYSSGKLYKNELEHRPQPIAIDANLSHFVNSSLINQSDMIFAAMNQKFTGSPLSGCKIRFTSMGSGPWVVDNPNVFEEIRSHIVGDCIALDMEAYAVAAAAHQMKIPWLIIKSVQDFADGKKESTEKDSRAYAAFSSTYALCEKLPELMKYLE